VTFYVRMAWRSVRRSRGLSTVMIVALSLGLGTWYSQRQILSFLESKVPVTHDGLYHVGLERDAATAPSRDVMQLLPSLLLTPHDAVHVAELAGATRTAITFGASAFVETDGSPAVSVRVRYATRDLFALFRIPLIGGASWSAAADAGLFAGTPTEEVVIDERFARRLFGTSNALGRELRVDGERLRVVGIVAAGYPDRYHLYERFIDTRVSIYLPLAHATAVHAVSDFQHPVANGESGTVQLWIDIAEPATVAAFAAGVASYLANEHARGRSEAPLRMKLRSSREWSRFYAPGGTVGLWPLLAGMCIVTCVVNLMRMLTAKFADRRHDLGLLRAFGARRGVVLAQLLIEATMIGVIAGGGGLLFGVVLMPLSISTINQALGAPTIISLDAVVAMFTLAIGAALLAAIPPAWLLSRGTPAAQLRTS
jgi:putative ABC transport system permease protein